MMIYIMITMSRLTINPTNDNRHDDYAMNGANTLNEDQVALIDVKLKQRFQLKKEGKYESADIIRDDLREKLGVNIDDRKKEWYVEGRFAALPAAAPVAEDEAVAEADVEEKIEAVSEEDDGEKLKQWLKRKLHLLSRHPFYYQNKCLCLFM